MEHPIPTPTPQTGLRALQAMLHRRHPLAALQVFHHETGDVFRINLPGFTPVVMVGPQAARFVLVQARGELRWRNENDPVTKLLRHGVLVEDGLEHKSLRELMNPSLHKRMLEKYLESMWHCTNQITATWREGSEVDMLVEMRKIALLILTETLFKVNFTPELEQLWQAVLGVIAYISPGFWMLWRGAPRSNQRKAQRQMDTYLYEIINQRRQLMDVKQESYDDLLSTLIASGMKDDLIRDQLLTMLIAGHDTSTALLAWSLYLLGKHPDIMCRAKAEVSSLPFERPPSIEEVRSLTYLDHVTREALRLYPPIHLGSRLAARDLNYQGYKIPAGDRVIYSIYLTQRHRDYWEEPDCFIPERHARGNKPAPYSWLAFGGGPRNCIGAAFAQMECKVVLGRILEQFDLKLGEKQVRPHMGATLEPRPGVRMQVLR